MQKMEQEDKWRKSMKNKAVRPATDKGGIIYRNLRKKIRKLKK